MNHHHTIQPLRSYRAHLVPQHVNASDVEDLADAHIAAFEEAVRNR